MLICKLCLIKIENADECKQIDKENLEMLEQFFPDMESYLMAGNICNYCNGNLRKHYEFKMKCLSINEQNSNKDLDNKLCRICLQLADVNDCLNLSKHSESNTAVIMLQTCLPEILNIHLFPESLICNNCWTKLKNCYEFTKMCRKNQKIALENDSVATNGIKVEVPENNTRTSDDDDNNSEDSEKDCLKCSKCTFQAKTKATLTKHELVHGEPQFKCKLCSYKGKRMEYLKNHMLIHEEPTLQCNKCSYKARSKRTLRNHMKLIHPKNKCEFPCPKCSYKGKRLDYLKSHMLVHLDSKSETTEMFKCDLCSYKTKRKYDLKYHMLVHRPQEIFKCPVCSYESKRKKNLTRHVLNHKKIKSKNKSVSKS